MGRFFILSICIVLLGTKGYCQMAPINDSILHHIPSQNNNDQSLYEKKQKPAPTDTSLNAQKHSPKKAMLLSMVLPGAGQAYNKKYWKIPVIFVAAGASLYGAIWNNKYYQDYKEQYAFRVENGYNEDPYYNQFQEPTLKANRDFYHKNRDLCYILLGATYILQIVDAGVDAHFYDFTITDKLTLHIEPIINLNQQAPAALMAFSFKF